MTAPAVPDPPAVREALAWFREHPARVDALRTEGPWPSSDQAWPVVRAALTDEPLRQVLAYLERVYDGHASQPGIRGGLRIAISHIQRTLAGEALALQDNADSAVSDRAGTAPTGEPPAGLPEPDGEHDGVSLWMGPRRSLDVEMDNTSPGNIPARFTVGHVGPGRARRSGAPCRECGTQWTECLDGRGISGHLCCTACATGDTHDERHEPPRAAGGVTAGQDEPDADAVLGAPQPGWVELRGVLRTIEAIGGDAPASAVRDYVEMRRRVNPAEPGPDAARWAPAVDTAAPERLESDADRIVLSLCDEYGVEPGELADHVAREHSIVMAFDSLVAQRERDLRAAGDELAAAAQAVRGLDTTDRIAWFERAAQRWAEVTR